MASLLSSSVHACVTQFALPVATAANVTSVPKLTVVSQSASVPFWKASSGASRPLASPPHASEQTAVDTFSSEVDGVFDWESEYDEVPVHTVVVHDRQTGVTYSVEVPQDQYILQTAEEEGIKLPFACRHGCCTACAVRVKSGTLVQPQALGISPELKEKGYALLCVGIPLSDLEVETQDEDEVYWQQFGKYFARGPIERDDYALELAMQDE